MFTPSSAFLQKLHGSLASTIAPEIDLTMHVGVMTAAGMTRAEILRQLRDSHPDATELDIKAAHQRLKRIAGTWDSEDRPL